MRKAARDRQYLSSRDAASCRAFAEAFGRQPGAPSSVADGMGVSAILARLVSFGEADWIPLWMIADEVEDELSSDDEDKTLEITVVLVAELLRHGFIAGDSPVSGDGIRFSAWSNQDPCAIARCIRREWIARGGPPGWHDSPWFSAPPAPRRHA